MCVCVHGCALACYLLLFLFKHGQRLCGNEAHGTVKAELCCHSLEGIRNALLSKNAQ